MSRSSYSDDDESNTRGLWRGAVDQAINGKRGQAALRDLLAALDAMPEKVLINEQLAENGAYCALGVLGAARGLPVAVMNPEDTVRIAREINIAHAMAREIMYMNDEYNWDQEEPAERWVRMRAWVAENIKAA